MLFCLSLAAACSADTPGITAVDPVVVPAGEVTAVRVPGGVTLHNGTSTALAYAVWNRGWLGQLGACTEPSPDCLRLPAGGSITVPTAEISGWDDTATEIAVYWWYVLPNGDGTYRASEITEIKLSA